MKNININIRQIDTNTFLVFLEKYKDKVSKSEKASKAFLVDLGIITEKGNLRKNYKNFYIPTQQA